MQLLASTINTITPDNRVDILFFAIIEVVTKLAEVIVGDAYVV